MYSSLTLGFLTWCWIRLKLKLIQLGFNRHTHPSASSYLKLVHGDSGFNGLFQAFPGEMKYIISPVYPGEIIYYILYISFVYVDINKSDSPNKKHYSLKGQITNHKKGLVCAPLFHLVIKSFWNSLIWNWDFFLSPKAHIHTLTSRETYVTPC